MTTPNDDQPLKFEDDERLVSIGDELVELLQEAGIQVSNIRTAEQWLYRAEIKSQRAVRLGDIRAVLFRRARAKAEPKAPGRPYKRKA